ncbi:hypothetical protein MASR2M70_05670 [Bacillota bacterium]
MKKKALSMFLSISLVFSLLTGMAFAAGDAPMASLEGLTFTDVQGHWARNSIQKAFEAGYVKGYPDGSFAPGEAVSRAEFVSMVNNALKLRPDNKVQLKFKDVKPTDWFYDELAKAAYVRYISGTSATSFSPQKDITRQEAAAMLSRFLPKSGKTGRESLDSFADKGLISPWAEEGLAVVVNKGYMKGRANGLLAPRGILTRAEAVTLIDKILTGETIVREDTHVKTSGDILRDKIYVGDIIIDREVGEGDAALNNLSALSAVYVNGGGVHTVTVTDSLIIRLVVTKEGTQVRVLAADGTVIYTSILFNNNLLVDENGIGANPDSETFEDIVVVQGRVTSEQALQIAGAIGRQVESGSGVTQEQVAQAVLSVLPGSSAKTESSGTIVVETPKPGGDRTPSKSIGITVTGAADYIGSEITALAAPAEAEAAYQWYRSETAAGVYTIIPEANKAKYAVTEADIGNYLKVTASGAAAYAGIQGNKVIGPVGFSGGKGTSTEPFGIANWYHLNNMRYQLDKHFKLMANLEREEVVEVDSLSLPQASAAIFVSTGYNFAVPEKGWEPLGQFPEPASEPEIQSSAIEEISFDADDTFFTGSFNGNGKIIKDLRVNKVNAKAAGADPPTEAAGLFGVLCRAEVKNLTLLDVYVCGSKYVGALAGYCRESSISGVIGEGTLEPRGVEASRPSKGVYGDYEVGGIAGRNDGGRIENCTNKQYVSGNLSIGGITGSNYAENPEPTSMSFESADVENRADIVSCSNEGMIKGNAYVGGIAGENGNPGNPDIESLDFSGNNTNTYISKSANYGYVSRRVISGTLGFAGIGVGGIAGCSAGTVSECYNEGEINGLAPGLGGIVGYTDGIIENCYNDGKVTGGDSFGGIVGYANGATISFNYNLGALETIEMDALYGPSYGEICGDDDGSVFSANFYIEEPGNAGARIGFTGIYPVSSAELRNPLTFKDMLVDSKTAAPAWNFSSVWALNLEDNEGYPFLRWQWNAAEYKPICLVVVMPTADAIGAEDPLSAATLRGGSVKINGVTVAGSFSYWAEYNDPTMVPPGESMEAMVIFTPANSAKYKDFAGKVNVQVVGD